jgi:hypothetical protein
MTNMNKNENKEYDSENEEYDSEKWENFVNTLIKRNVFTYSAYAAKRSYQCLKYAHENGFLWNERTCYYAAESGRIDCLIYAHVNGCPWGGMTCYHAARGGHIECLMYAIENGCKWDYNICLNAASRAGRIECINYITMIRERVIRERVIRDSARRQSARRQSARLDELSLGSSILVGYKSYPNL